MAPSSLSVSTTSTACVSATSAAGLYLPQTYSFLSPETFETLVEGYINQLHVRKRNKALISQQLANDCLMVLTNPENTAIFNPKFRWWVRKHFVFTVVGELRILMDKKNGKPVCVREQLYDKVCYFHHIIGHGGRDKTFAAVRLLSQNCGFTMGRSYYNTGNVEGSRRHRVIFFLRGWGIYACEGPTFRPIILHEQREEKEKIGTRGMNERVHGSITPKEYRVK